MHAIKKMYYGILKKNRHFDMEFYARIHYQYYHNKKLDLKNPVTYNQKLQWLKVYYHPPVVTNLVDKYAVRKYVEEKIGSKYLNELYAVYDSPLQVNFDQLPDQFVIKGTHGCNMNLLVSEKAKLNKSIARLKMYKWLRKNWYYSTGQEWAYKDVKPRLIAEKYLGELDGRINDYRFFTFSGEIRFVQVINWVGEERFNSFYDLNWEKLPFYYDNPEPYQGVIKKPNQFQEMLDVAVKLADKFPFVRVDLYEIDKRVLFGEMTFYPADCRSSFMPEEYNKSIGDYMILPNIPEGHNEISQI